MKLLKSASVRWMLGVKSCPAVAHAPHVVIAVILARPRNLRSDIRSGARPGRSGDGDRRRGPLIRLHSLLSQG